jgi:hypothetical protein
MKTGHLILTFAFIVGLAGSGSALAAGDLTAQTPVEIKVQLGDKANALRFFPDKIELETGKLYKLVLNNPSTWRITSARKDCRALCSRGRSRSWARTGRRSPR